MSSWNTHKSKALWLIGGVFVSYIPASELGAQEIPANDLTPDLALEDQDVVDKRRPSSSKPEEREPTFVLEVDVTSGITDRVRLQQQIDTVKTESFFSAFEPELAVNLASRRAALEVIYTPQIIYFEEEDRTDVRQSGSFAGKLDLLEEFISLNVDGSIDQLVAFQGLNLTGTDYNISDERVALQNYSAGPTIYGPLGSTIFVNGYYRFGLSLAQQFSENLANGLSPIQLRDSVTHSGGLNLVKAIPSLGIELSGEGEGLILDQKDGPTFKRLDVRGEVALNIFDSVSLLVAGGYYDVSDRTGFDGGELLLGGFKIDGRWLELQALAGVRGDDTIFEGELTADLGRNVELKGQYSDTFETFQSAEVLGIFDPSSPSFDPTVLPSGTISDFSFTNDVFRQKSGNLSLNVKTDLLEVSVSGLYVQREFSPTSQNDQNAEVIGGSATLKFNLTNSLSVSGTGNFTRSQLAEIDRADEISSGQAKLTWQLTDAISLSASYLYASRTSSNTAFDGEENIGFLRLSTAF